MEGILYVPPDRGTIIGRAIWKPRYVVVADPSDAKQRVQQQRQQSSHAGSASSASRGQQQPPPPPPPPPPRAATPRSPDSLSLENTYLSIFKSKGDWEPIQQHAISSITDCQVQMLAHRKQGPVLPTLVISISPDPITDKLRKRRSSRTAGLTTTKETGATTLWFRPAEDSNQKHILHDWCRFIQVLVLQLGSATPSAPLPSHLGTGPLSPLTPASPTFINPFASSPRGRAADFSDFAALQHHHQQPPPQHQYAQRPTSGNNTAGRSNGLGSKSTGQTATASQSSQAYSSRERERERERDRDRDRPKTYSESPSLRSRRSDLSHTSSNLPPHVTTPGYSSSSSSNNFALPFFHNRPTDLPSPATTVNEFQGDLVEGWTIAQSRSSTLSSPIRGRDSISSQPPLPMAVAAGLPAPSPGAGTIGSSSPPAPRETILDRAFQMRFIPGSDRDPAIENQLTSLARFDALMQEVDERKRLRLAVGAPDGKRSTAIASILHPEAQPKSGWDLDDDSDDSDGSVEDGDGDDLDEEEDEDGIASGGDDGLADGGMRRRDGHRADSSSLRPSDQLHAAVNMAPNTRRALDFIIAGRRKESERESRRTLTPKPHGGGFVDYDAQAPMTSGDGYFPSTTQRHQQEPILRPQTGYARNRPPIAQRTHSQPQLAALSTGTRHAHAKHAGSPISPCSPPPLPRSSTFSKVDEIKIKAAATTASGSLGATTALDKRQSASSIKRLSFTDFTRRLSSSTSSLLLVQTNTSGGSASGSGSGNVSGTGSIIHEGVDTPTPAPVLTSMNSPRGEKHNASHSFSSTNSHGHQHSSSTSSRLTSPPPPPPAAERCGWRGSVSVISTEGGFL